MERVTTITGKLPILIIAPHGFDDTNTNIMAAKAAESINAYAVINNGWERANSVDALNDKANCNNIPQIQEDVVKEEFLDPITKFIGRILKSRRYSININPAHVFIVHGCGNDVRNGVDPSLAGIIGFGKGLSDTRLSAEHRRVELFNTIADNDACWKFYNAPEGSRFSGFDRNNLNQYWVRAKMSQLVQSMQIEFVTATRRTAADAELSGILLGSLILQYYEESLRIDEGTSKLKTSPLRYYK